MHEERRKHSRKVISSMAGKRGFVLGCGDMER